MAKASRARKRRWPWLVVAAAVPVVCLATAVGAWAQGVHAWHLLLWAGLAGTVVFTAGLAVPAAISRRDQRAAQRTAEQEHLAQIEAELQAVMRPMSVPARPDPDPGRSGGSPAALLRPDRQVVGFTGRQAELLSLQTWAHRSYRGVVRLITGPGGTGKTRLAVEFASQLQAEGWHCGQLTAGCGGRAIAAIAGAGHRTLLVVDYAEALTDLEPLLETLAAHNADPVIRVLLLARTLGEWWQPDGPLRRHAAIRDVLTGAEAVELGPLTGTSQRQQETFNAALEAFAAHYGIPVPPATLRPVANDTPVLLLHTAALTAVLDARESTGTPGPVAANTEVVAELLGHEDNYWSDTATIRGLDQLGVGPGVRRQVVAIAGLLGADNEQEAREVLRRLPILAGASVLTVEQVLGWLRELYPATSSSWLGSIQPDLLLEYLVTSVFSRSGELADAALTNLAEHRANHALAMLARALDHYPTSADPLLRRLLTAHADLLAVAAVRLARNLDTAGFSQIIADIITNAQITNDVLTALAADLQQQIPVSLVPVTIALYLRVGAGDVATGRFSSAADAALALRSLADNLRQLGLHGTAVSAYRAAVRLFRMAEEAEPGRYRTDLALALTNLGAALGGLGQERDARPVLEETVGLYRVAEEAKPGRYRTHLARALTNLGNTLGGLGQQRDARPVLEEAVGLYQAAEEAKPGRYRTELAHALTNLGNTLRKLSHPEEALAVTKDAVRLYRMLTATDWAAYHGTLAAALIACSGALLDLGRYEEAENARREADRYGDNS